MTMVAPDQRFTRSHPCRVCGGYDQLRRGRGIRCFGFESGEWCYCTREEYAGGAPWNDGTNGWRHRLEGECRCGITHGSLVLQPHEPTPRRRSGTTASGDGCPSRIVDTYDYPVDGELIFQVVRYDPKDFRQRRPDPTQASGWSWNLDGVTPVLYRLDELRAADPFAPVFGVEGEADVEALRAIGIVATCSPMGAGKWRPEYAEELRGRTFIAWPDPDPPGQRHGDDMVRTTLGVAASVRRLEMPSDARDWLAAGGTREELLALAAAAPVIQPPATAFVESDPCADLVAALRAENDQIKAALATAQERFRKVLALDRNGAAKTQRSTLKAIAFELASAYDGGRADEGRWVKTTNGPIATNAGVSEDTYIRNRKTLVRDGLIEEKVEYEFFTWIDTATGEIATDYNRPIPRVYLRCPSVDALLDEGATWTPSPPPKKPQQGAWGGLREPNPETCPHAHVQSVCLDCGADVTEAPDPQLADQGTTPAEGEEPPVAARTLDPQDADQATETDEDWPPGWDLEAPPEVDDVDDPGAWEEVSVVVATLHGTERCPICRAPLKRDGSCGWGTAHPEPVPS